MKGIIPKTYNGDLLNPPRALAPLFNDPNFVVWNWKQDDKGNWSKPPFSGLIPSRNASTTNSTTWTHAEICVQLVRKGRAHGLGYVLTNSGVAAVDLDKCRDPETGEIDVWAQNIIGRAPEAYVEATVSGTGLRIIGTGSGESVHRKFAIADAQPRAAIETYRKATRFITVSGLQIGSCAALTNIDDVIDGIVAEHDKPSSNGHGNGHDPGFTFESVLEDDIDQAIKNGVPEGQRSEAFSQGAAARDADDR